MLDDARLNEALELLGALLTERNQPFEVLAVGGGALLLLGVSSRTTADLDVVARRRGQRWTRARPLPPSLVQAVDDVAMALKLEATDKPWLNDGPWRIFEMGLPEGWESRTTTKRFGALLVRLLGREDSIKLKLFAATNPHAPERRERDVSDLRQLAPTREALLDGLRWCEATDGTADFLTSPAVVDVLRELGVSIDGKDIGHD
jgi:hypothetical protein